MMNRFLLGKKLFKVAWVPVLVAVSTSTHSFQSSQKALNGLAGAYGYVASQELALRRIEQQFPEYSQAVKFVSLEFESAFPGAREKIRRKILELIGEEQGGELLNTLDKGLAELPNTNRTPTGATSFLETVSSRAKGAIERDNVKSFLNAIVYFERPEREMADNLSKRFSTTGDAKAKGLEVSFRVPQSWEEREGNTPNTIRSWQSEAGAGLSRISILIQDSNDRRTKKDIQRAISVKRFDELLPAGAIVRKIQETEVSNRYGWYAEYEHSARRVDMEILVITRNLYILHEGKRIEIGCGTGGLISKREEIQREASRIEGLCRAVLSSMVIDSVYKR